VSDRERSDLLDSAEFLNRIMREIRDSEKVVRSGFAFAVIAALNMANELIRFRNRDGTLESEVGGRLRILRERVESALEKGPTARTVTDAVVTDGRVTATFFERLKLAACGVRCGIRVTSRP